MRSFRTWLREKRRHATSVPESLGKGFQALYDCDSLGLATLTPDGRFLATNKGLQRMLGYDGIELAALTLNEVTHPDDIPRCEKEFDRLKNREIENFVTEKRYLRKDGEPLWTHIVVAAVREHGQVAHTVEVAMDITKRKQAEESVRSLTAELTGRVNQRTTELREKSDALERSNVDLDMFAYTAAHDLNAPLRRVIGFGDLLRDNLKDRLDPAGTDLLKRMQDSASGMSKLITDVLALARVGREPLPPEDVDLNELAASVIADLQGEIDAAGAAVEAGPMPVVRAHSVLLRRVLQNLIANAIKFRRRDAPLRVRVESAVHDSMLELSVADNGIGFEQKDADKVFEPFVRLHPAGEYLGSGIGLAICRRIAERYGGSITAVSEPDGGSIFKLELPGSMLVSV